MFDVTDHLDGLRSRPTPWLLERREQLVRDQRRLRVEELAVTRVLDERGTADDTLAARDGVSARTIRETIETARALESLPCLAAAAHAGALSNEQLGHVAQLADEASDAEWADRAPFVAPVDLARMVRTLDTPTIEDGRARQEARSLRMWWSADTGMLNLRGALADLDGARFEATINRVIEGMKPPPHQRWDSHDHRAADALVQLCVRDETPGDPDAPVAAHKPLLVVQIPRSGPATVAGVPLPDARVEQLRANANIEPVLVDDDGAPVAIGARFPGLSPKLSPRFCCATVTADSVPATAGTASRFTTSYPAPGAAPTTLPISPPSATPAGIIRCSSPTAPGRFSATPTNPTGSASSATATSPTTKPGTTDCRHPIMAQCECQDSRTIHASNRAMSRRHLRHARQEPEAVGVLRHLADSREAVVVMKFVE